MKNEKTIPEEDIEYVKVCLSTPQDIKKWVEDVTRSGDAPRYNFSGWPSDLWNRPATEILEYLEDRFYETDDVQEYYRCMLYLTKVIDAEALFVPWNESPNFKRIQAAKQLEDSQGNTNIAPQKKVVNCMGKVRVKSPQSRVKVMASSKVWRTM